MQIPHPAYCIFWTCDWAGGGCYGPRKGQSCHCLAQTHICKSYPVPHMWVQVHFFPLTALLKNNPQTLNWNPEAEYAFVSLKHAFMTMSILHHLDPEKPFVVEVECFEDRRQSYSLTKVWGQGQNVPRGLQVIQGPDIHTIS